VDLAAKVTKKLALTMFCLRATHPTPGAAGEVPETTKTSLLALFLQLTGKVVKELTAERGFPTDWVCGMDKRALWNWN